MDGHAAGGLQGGSWLPVSYGRRGLMAHTHDSLRQGLARLARCRLDWQPGYEGLRATRPPKRSKE